MRQKLQYPEWPEHASFWISQRKALAWNGLDMKLRGRTGSTIFIQRLVKSTQQVHYAQQTATFVLNHKSGCFLLSAYLLRHPLGCRGPPLLKS